MDQTKLPGISVFSALAIFWGLASGFQCWAKSFGGNVFLDYEYYLLCFLPLAAGIGVLMRKTWGRFLYIAWAILCASFYVASIVRDIVGRHERQEELLSYIIALACFTVFFAIPVWYFNRPVVKAQFR